MGKKLDSILSQYPSATVSPVANTAEINNITHSSDNYNGKNQFRLVAIIPFSLKQEIKRYLANHPEDTERTIVLKGLKSLGFDIKAEEIKDKRGYKK